MEKEENADSGGSRSRLLSFVLRHERRLSSAALLCGFIFDTFTLTGIAEWRNHVIILAYIATALLGIILSELSLRGRFGGFRERIATLSPIATQFAFGALWSAFLVYYWRSASFASSWFFLLLLLSLLIGNEFFRERYRKLEFRLAVFFLALFAYLIFLLPVLSGTKHWIQFPLSGLIAMALVTSVPLALLLARILEEKREVLRVGGITLAIFGVMSVLYYANIIPPVPLSLKEAEIYHSVVREEDGDYAAQKERDGKGSMFLSRPTLHITPGGTLSFYSSVLAPTRFTTPIVHEWQFDDPNEGWITRSRITFPISGGRDLGYRGYSTKETLESGNWRVIVRTEDGSVLGRRAFRVIQEGTPPELESIVL